MQWAIESESICAEERSFRVYVTDMLKLSGEGKTLNDRWASLLQSEPEYDPDEIADGIIARMEW